MSFLTLLAAEEHHDLAPMIMDPIFFPMIAAGVFILLGFVTWSFRDVANRHSHKTDATGRSTDH